MSLESGEQRRSTKGVAPATEPEHLPCPRCDSTNTKFCYYNNYNFSQPRHFCKACRRYWTHGGTLRDIPVGGGSRKNAKRSRASSSSASSIFATDYRHLPANVAPIFLPLPGGYGADMKFQGLNVCGSFTSLLNTQGPSAAGLLTLGGFEDSGFGLGRAAVWPFSAVGDCGANGGSTSGNTWQLESVESGGFSSGELF